MTRPLPWTDLLAALGEQRFIEVRDALAAAGTNDLDRDAFLLNGTVATLLRDLVPADAPSGTVNAYGALLHMLHAAWARDWPLRVVEAETLAAIVAAPAPLAARTPPPAVCYVQLPERIVWGEPTPGDPHEPLDGVFVIAQPRSARLCAVLGFRPGRPGFTTMDADLELPAPAPGPRPDGSAPWASTMPGGAAAGLFSVATPDELAALALAALEPGATGHTPA